MNRKEEEYKDLIQMKKSRKQIKAGDVFVVQPVAGLYYFGKVIRTDVQRPPTRTHGWYLIYIYDQAGTEIEVLNDLEASKLLCPPLVMNHQGWLQGYFVTVGTAEVTDADREVDFGFLNLRKEFIDVDGHPMSHEPKRWTTEGITSYGKVGRILQEKLRSSTKAI